MANHFVEHLVNCGCLTFFNGEPFKYASGAEGPIYCDNRKILGFPEERSVFVESFMSLIEKEKVDCDLVVGMATGGVPIAAILADRLGLPFCYVRSSAKKHGQSKLIEGCFEEGMKVILIEDLINQGGSVYSGAQKVLEANLSLQAVFSLVNYSFESSERLLSKLNCPVYSLVSFDDLQRFIENDPSSGKDILRHIINWHKDPLNWSLEK